MILNITFLIVIALFILIFLVYALRAVINDPQMKEDLLKFKEKLRLK